MTYRDGFTLEELAAAYYKSKGYRVHIVHPTTHRKTESSGAEDYETVVDLFGVLDLLAILEARSSQGHDGPTVTTDQVTRDEGRVAEKMSAIVDEGLWPVRDVGFAVRFWVFDGEPPFRVHQLQYSAASEPNWGHAFDWWPDEDAEDFIARWDHSLDEEIA